MSWRPCGCGFGYGGIPKQIRVVGLTLLGLSPCRLSSIKCPITNVQFRQGKTHATFGLHCVTGEVTIRRDILVIWELGAERRMKELEETGLPIMFVESQSIGDKINLPGFLRKLPQLQLLFQDDNFLTDVVEAAVLIQLLTLKYKHESPSKMASRFFELWTRPEYSRKVKSSDSRCGRARKSHYGGKWPVGNYYSLSSTSSWRCSTCCRCYGPGKLAIDAIAQLHMLQPKGPRDPEQIEWRGS